jgi:hypothetical protein
MSNMHTDINVHNADSISIKPVNRIESSSDLGYFYEQAVEITGENGEATTFRAFFNDAVSKRMEQERLADEHREAQDQAGAMEFLEGMSKARMGAI